MRHGQLPSAETSDDPYFSRIGASLEEYALLEAAFCSCDALCTCGWDEKENDDTA